jgi:glyceraldehyde 3-phosphate dehydrogenase
MALNVAINGFGRIGRCFLRCILQDSKANKDIRVVAINTGPHKPENLDILFKYDSIMGTFPGNVSIKDNKLVIDNHEIALLSEADPEKLPWKQMGIDWVIESSGCFTIASKARKHLTAGAQKVLITAPATDEDITVIPGVNDAAYDTKKHSIVSLGSCTTNCFAPVVKVLHETFGINHGLMTTTHAYTNDQVLLDVEHKDPRRARAAALNMVPTKTGADKVIIKVFPALEGKIKASAVRVPVAIVSLLDFTFTSARPIDKEAINNACKKYADGPLKGILEYCTQPLVSSDFAGNQASCIVDSLLTQATGTMGKVFAWYDNEFGYSSRLKDFLLHNL